MDFPAVLDSVADLPAGFHLPCALFVLLLLAKVLSVVLYSLIAQPLCPLK